MHVEPLILGFSAAAPSDRRSAASSGFGATLSSATLLSPFSGGLTLLILVLAGSPLATGLAMALATAIIIPILVSQDFLRYAAYAEGAPIHALLNSSCWTAAIASVLLVQHLLGWPLGAVGYLLVWGVSALGGVGVGLAVQRIAPSIRNARSWYQVHHRIIRKLLADWALLQITAEGSLLIIASVAGAPAAGLLRKAQLPLAPITILTNGLSAILQPWTVRQVAAPRPVAALKRNAWLIGVTMAVLAFCGGLAIYSLPDDVMTAVVGEGWTEARELVPYLSAYLGLGALAAILGVTLRALGKLSEQVRVRQFLLPVTLLIVVVGAMRGEALGAAVALLISVALVVIAWGVLLHQATNTQAEAAR